MNTTYSIGDEVQSISDPSRIGAVVEIGPLHAGVQFYRVNFGMGMRTMVSEVDLRPYKASRSRFAQHTLSPEAVAAELQSVRAAIGRSEDVARFFAAVLQIANVPLQTRGKAVAVHLSNGVPRALRQAVSYDDPFIGRFDLPLQEGEIYLERTSPVIEGLASWTLDQARDPVVHDARPVASRTRRRVTVQPVFPVDILGACILLPIPPQLRERGR